MVGLGHVDTQAVEQREPVGGLPNVLDKGADLRVLPGTGAVRERHAIRKDVDEVRTVVAGGDLVHRRAVAVLVIETVGAVQQLPEYIGSLVAHEIESRLDDVVAQMPGAGERTRVELAVDRILMAEPVFTRDDPVDAGWNAGRAIRAVGCGSGEARVHLGLVQGRAIGVVVLLVAELELGAERVGPVAEQLERIVVGRAGRPCRSRWTG